MSYATEVLADAPVVYWRLGEPSGATAEDETANNYDGTYDNTPTLGASGALTGSGDTDTAVTFASASSERVQRASVVSTATNNMTFECWVKLASVTAGFYYLGYNGDISTGGAGGAKGWGVGIHDGSGGNGLKLVADASWVAFIPTNYTFADTNWHHIVFGRDAGTWRAFVDATEVTVTAGGGTNPSTPAGGKTSGGAAWDTGIGDFARHLNGSLDEIAFYDTFLGATRVSAHYEAGTTPPPGPSYFPLVTREYPATRLHVVTTTPSGKHNRWGQDERRPEDIPKDLSFSTVMPGGVRGDGLHPP